MRRIAMLLVAVSATVSAAGGCGGDKADEPAAKHGPAVETPTSYDGWTEGKPGQYCVDRSKLGETSPGCPTEISAIDATAFPKLMGKLKSICDSGPIDVPGVPSVGTGYVTEASGDRCCYSFECVVVPG